MAFNFGNPTTTTTTATPFSFGSNPNASFGAAATNQGGLTLGAPATTSTGGFSFGASSSTQPAAPATGGFSFGSQPAAPAQAAGGLTFGASPIVSSAPALGGGLSFGLKPTAIASPLTAAKPTASAAPTSAAQLSFFSTPAASTAQQPTTTTAAGGISFGLNAQTAITFNSLTPAVSSGPLFIGPSTNQAPPKLNFLGGAATSGTATTTSGATGGLSFGFNTAAKTTATTGLTFSTPTTGGATGLFGLSATTSTPATATTTASTTFKGLGGVDSTTFAGGSTGSTGGGRTENKTVKVNQVPNDIIQSIEGFKGFVKTQKNLSCEVARASAKPLAKVTDNTNGLEKLLASLSADLQKNSILVNKLKDDTSKVFAQCEMAQRTHDTPAGLQNDNLAPLEFFMNLVAKFEHSAQVLRQEIDNTEKHVNTLNQPAMLTSQELLMALRRLHESFVALAGRLQLVHQMVNSEKQRHLAMRRHFLKDTADIFSRPALDQSAAAKRGVGVSTGPTPFSSIGVMHSLGPVATQDTPLVSFNNQSTMGWGSSMPGSSSVQAVGSASPFQFFSSSATDNFQLSKPPPGNKRGKR